MIRSWSFRVLLILVLASGIVAIVFSLRSRSDHNLSLPGPFALLSPEVSQQSTGFEYSQLKEGRVLFKVFAETSTLTRVSEHWLDSVRLERYGPDGQSTDSIVGRGALYQIGEKQIEFRNDVVIHLADGTVVYADWAGADLESETVQIQGSFSFEQANLVGRGRGLTYPLPERKLIIRDGLRLDFQVTGRPAHAESGAATYRLDEGRVLFSGGTVVEMGGDLLKGDSVDLELDPDRRLERLTARDGAYLSLFGVHEFIGESIRLTPPADERESGQLEVLGGPSGLESGVQRARFRETMDGGPQECEASRLDASLVRLAEAEGFVLESLRGSGEVGFHSQPLGIEQGRAHHLRIEFGEDGRTVRHLLLSGDVGVMRNAEGSGQSRTEKLTSPRLELDTDLDGPRLAVAEGPAELEVSGLSSTRLLRASKQMELSFSEGILLTAVATGETSLFQTSSQGENRLESSGLRMDFQEGLPLEALAEGKVALFLERNGETSTLTGRDLRIGYREGEPSEGLLSGGVRLRRGDPAGTMDLTGESATYLFESGLLAVQGGDRPRMTVVSEGREVRINADRFAVNEQSREIVAEGSVESSTPEKLGSGVVVAEKMVFGGPDGWITYEGNPSLLQGSNYVRGDVLRIDPENQRLVAEGKVDTQWVQADPAPGRKSRITARRFEMELAESKGLYEEDVQFLSDDLDLVAPRLDLYFESGTQGALERLEASGGVKIREKDRRWTAERATYLSGTDRVVVSH